MAFLEIKNLTKRFGETEVLSGVGFCADKGEILAITGASGSGKTTLLRCLNFLEPFEKGEIWLDGQQLYTADKRYREQEIRQKRLNFGFVFQAFNLFPQYTALQNVTLAMDVLSGERPKGDSVQLTKAEIKRQNRIEAESLLERLGLADKMGSYPSELSGGQQQRVAIARALALKPKVLCFDEPTSALDSSLADEVVAVIESLNDNTRAILIITHSVDLAKRYRNYRMQ